MNKQSLIELSGVSSTLISEIVALTKPKTKFGRPRKLTHWKSVVLVLIWLRLNLTDRELGILFNISQPTAHRTIKRVLPLIAGLFPNEINHNPKEHLLLDGTLIPTEDRSITEFDRKKQRSVNVQIVANRHKEILFISPAFTGNRQDTFCAQQSIPKEFTYISDNGYRGFSSAILPPKNDAKSLLRHRTVRSRIEHVIGRLKVWRVFRRLRKRGDVINQVLPAVSYLYNWGLMN